jgi:tRNA threonylcarbamoyladenosine biosynthesis protein TsaB
MWIVALDTTTPVGSVALARDGEVIASRTGDATISHGRRLPGDIAALLEDQRLTPGSIDLYGVAAGPGSFTGLRVGIATIQGLAFARARRVVAVSTLEALAYAACEHVPPELGTHVVACMDGQRGDLFVADFEVTAIAPACLLAPAVDAVSIAPEAFLARLRDTRTLRAVLLTGDGALRYGEAIDAALGEVVPRLDPLPPLAPTIARLAFARRADAVVPHAIQPVYVRRPDAELARESTRREGGHGES